MLQGKLVLNFCPVDLVEVVREAIASIHLSAEAKSIHIETRLEAEIGQVLGSSARLQQVVWNLLSNAVKFTPEHGRVAVYLTQSGTQVQIQVSDTGRGIETGFLPYVFDYFRQAEGNTTRAFGGLGLGLAISRYLVELHGGQIQAASEGEGKGATFTVWLPLQESDRTSETHRSGDALENRSKLLQGQQILLVDPIDDERELLVVILEQAGAAVTTVASASASLQALIATPACYWETLRFSERTIMLCPNDFVYGFRSLGKRSLSLLWQPIQTPLSNQKRCALGWKRFYQSQWSQMNW
ncbi:MAG: ATP-binding protein [Leptolyngbya sp. BL-A-14]